MMDGTNNTKHSSLIFEAVEKEDEEEDEEDEGG